MARKRQPEEVRREQILQAAFDVAGREGIGGLTVRAVATEAGISHALVLFHFGRKERLVHALLDRVIGGTAVLHISDDIARCPRVRDRLHALFQQEMSRLSREPQQTRLFLEFWALGARDEGIGTQISAELEGYRSAFVSWIHGCAVQAMIDPRHFDTDEYLTSVRGMIGRLG